MDDKPVVDEKALAECLHLERIPDWYKLQNHMQRVAARIITDSVGKGIDGTYQPIDIAMSNAQYWVDQIYYEGKRVGIELERQRFKRNILEFFGL